MGPWCSNSSWNRKLPMTMAALLAFSNRHLPLNGAKFTAMQINMSYNIEDQTPAPKLTLQFWSEASNYRAQVVLDCSTSMA
jgi:hypothetical protein